MGLEDLRCRSQDTDERSTIDKSNTVLGIGQDSSYVKVDDLTLGKNHNLSSWRVQEKLKMFPHVKSQMSIFAAEEFQIF